MCGPGQFINGPGRAMYNKISGTGKAVYKWLPEALDHYVATDHYNLLCSISTVVLTYYTYVLSSKQYYFAWQRSSYGPKLFSHIQLPTCLRACLYSSNSNVFTKQQRHN